MRPDQYRRETYAPICTAQSQRARRGGGPRRINGSSFRAVPSRVSFLVAASLKRKKKLGGADSKCGKIAPVLLGDFDHFHFPLCKLHGSFLREFACARAGVGCCARGGIEEEGGR